MAVEIDDILSVLGDDVLSVHGPSSVGSVDPMPLDVQEGRGGLAFCNDTGSAAVARITGSNARVVICHDCVAKCLARGGLEKVVVAVVNPRLAYVQVVNCLYQQKHEIGIDATATVHATARLGDRVTIGPNSIVDEDCYIGEDTMIDANVRLYGRTRVGRNVRIYSGAILGADGFGFERAPDGKLHRFPQRGHVEIGNGVEIGANVCIDRAAMDVTRIGAGTKIDDLAYIAHNVQIGVDCLIMASAIVAGSSIVGDRVEISPGAIIRDKVAIGEGARIGLGAVVVADVPGGSTVVGVPAKPTEGRGQPSSRG